MINIICFSASNNIIGRIPSLVAYEAYGMYMLTVGKPNEEIYIYDFDKYISTIEEDKYNILVVPVFSNKQEPYIVIHCGSFEDIYSGKLTHVKTTHIILELNLNYVLQSQGELTNEVLYLSDEELNNTLDADLLKRAIEDMVLDTTETLHFIRTQQDQENNIKSQVTREDLESLQS